MSDIDKALSDVLLRRLTSFANTVSVRITTAVKEQQCEREELSQKIGFTEGQLKEDVREINGSSGIDKSKQAAILIEKVQTAFKPALGEEAGDPLR